MNRISISLLTLLAYFALGSAIALLARRRLAKDASDYYIAGSRLGGFTSAMTYAATTYSAFMMIGLVGLSYDSGVGALGFELVYFVGTLFLLSLFSKKVLRQAKERGWISPSEMLGDLYGSKGLASLVAFVYLFALIPYASAQLKGIGELVAGLSGSTPEFYAYGVALGLVAILLWTLVAGVWSVAWTDAFQGVWMISAALGFVAWLIPWALGFGFEASDVAQALDRHGLTSVGVSAGFWTPQVFVSFTLPWLFFAVTNPQVVQRLFMPKDEVALKRMMTWFAAFGFTYTVLVTLIGLIGRGLVELKALAPFASRDLVTPTLLTYAPVWLSSFVFTSIVAAAVSTADSIVLTLASCAARDLRASPKGGSSWELSVGRAAVLAIIAATSIVAYARVGFVVELSVLSSVLLLPLAPITISAWVRPLKSKAIKVAATLSLASGVSVAAFCAVAYGPTKAFSMTWCSVPVSAWILIVSTSILLLGHISHMLSPRRASGNAI